MWSRPEGADGLRGVTLCAAGAVVIAGAVALGASRGAAPAIQVEGAQEGREGALRDRRQETQAAQERQRSPESKTAHELVPMREVRREFAITDGEREGERLIMTLLPAETAEGYILQFGDEYRLHLSKAETVYVLQLDLIQENKAVLYDPPVELIPSTVEAGREMSSRGLATVYELDSGEESREGRFEHRFQRVSRSEFNLPGGAAHGYLLDVLHEIEFDNAEMRIDLEIGTDDRGIIYWRYKSDLEKLGLFGSTTISQYEAVGPARAE